MILPNETRLLARLAAIGVAALVVCTIVSPATGNPRQRSSSSRRNHAALIRVSTAKLRSGPGTDHKAVALLDEGRSARVIARAGEWAKIRLESGRTGWVRRDLIDVSKKATRDPNAPSASRSKTASRSRSSATAKKPRIQTASATKKATPPRKPVASKPATAKPAVVAAKPKTPPPAPVKPEPTPDREDTIPVEATNGDDQIEITVDTAPAATLSPSEVRIERARAALVGEAMNVYDADNEPNRASTGRSALVSRAKSLRGTPYRFGSTGRGSFDCSGFTQFLFRRQGINIPRTAAEQFRAGKSVGRSDLRSGDLVFFRNTAGRSGISHVGMYIGDGQFIHASSRGRGVCIDSLSKDYYRAHFAGSRRFVK